MSLAAVIDDGLSDAALALHLFMANPALFGGIILRGDTPARDAMVAHARAAIEPHGPIAKIPVTIDSERLLGGLDLSATLAAGRSVRRNGVLDGCAGGAVIVPMAERLPDAVAAHLALALDGGDVAAVLLDDGCEPDEAPPAVLGERIAFHCDVTELRHFDPAAPTATITFAAVDPLSDAQRGSIAAMSVALGVDSARALIFADRAARAHAALHARTEAADEDVTAAVRLILSPRATRVPQSEAPPPPEPQPDSGEPEPDTPDEDSRSLDDLDLDDILLDAAATAIPQHILDQMDGRARGQGRGQAGRSGQKQQSGQRGRPLSSRAGVPGHGKRLALIDTLRAAAPWQTIRRNAASAAPGGTDDHSRIHIRKADLRVRHYEQRRTSLTIFAVDASGSSAMARLAEAKGAVELMLAQAYVKRSEVALIAFRQSSAEILLPPTRSLTRARRALAALPGSGGTPLSAALIAVQTLAQSADRGGATPTIALLTDGKANIMLDGTANRVAAIDESLSLARQLAHSGWHSIVIDISPRPRPEAAALAEALGGRYLPLPAAQSAAMVAAIEGLAAS